MIAPTRSRVRIPSRTNFHPLVKKNPLIVLTAKLGPLGHRPNGGVPPGRVDSPSQRDAVVQETIRGQVRQLKR